MPDHADAQHGARQSKYRRQPERGRTTTGSTPAATTRHNDSDTDEALIMMLQRTIGNQATLQLLRETAPVGIAPADVIQLGRKNRRKHPQTNTGPQLSQDEIKKRIREGQKRRAEEKAKKNSWLGWFASWVPGASYDLPSKDEEEDDDDDDDNTIAEADESVFSSEVELGNKPEDEGGDDDEGGGSTENPFAIQELEIDIGKMEIPDSRLGAFKASGKSTVSPDKATAKGKASTEGTYGKGDASGKLEVSTDNIKGEGKVNFLLGGSTESKSGTLNWGIKDNTLSGSGKMESKVGLSGDLASKLAVKSSGDFAAEGKIGAMLGASTEGTVTVKLKSGGKDIGSTEGKLGLAYGAGGELSGTLKWEGGKFEFGWHGKLVAGVGFSYGYKVVFDTEAASEVMVGWLPTIKYYLWDAWELPDDFDEDDILIL